MGNTMGIMGSMRGVAGVGSGDGRLLGDEGFMTVGCYDRLGLTGGVEVCVRWVWYWVA